jgi:hypothetical protein
MNSAFGGGAFAGDDAVAHNGEGLGCGIPAGNPGGFQSDLRGIDLRGVDRFGTGSKRGGHW